jgi:hypothetical protein
MIAGDMVPLDCLDHHDHGRTVEVVEVRGSWAVINNSRGFRNTVPTAWLKPVEKGMTMEDWRFAEREGWGVAFLRKDGARVSFRTSSDAWPLFDQLEIDDIIRIDASSAGVHEAILEHLREGRPILREEPVPPVKKGDRVWFIRQPDNRECEGVVHALQRNDLIDIRLKGDPPSSGLYYRLPHEIDRKGHTHCHAGAGGCAACDAEARAEEALAVAEYTNLAAAEAEEVLKDSSPAKVRVAREYRIQLDTGPDEEPTKIVCQDGTTVAISDFQDSKMSPSRYIAAMCFRKGDRARVKPAARDLVRPGEPEIMVVAKFADDGIVEMTHVAMGGPALWAPEHLDPVVDNTTCTRCGAGAYEGLFSTTCQRPGGCKTIDECVGEPRIDGSGVSSWVCVELRFKRYDIVRVLSGGVTGREPAWYIAADHQACYATQELAVVAWKARRRELERNPLLVATVREDGTGRA